MRTVTLYGASDDLIEIDGDIREEFSATRDGNEVHFSDGTILRIKWDFGGIWRIAPIKRGTAALAITQLVSGDAEEEDEYSDRAALTGDITWVSLGPPQRLGEIAYRGFFKAREGHTGRDVLPSWDELSQETRGAWQAAAEAVRDEVSE